MAEGIVANSLLLGPRSTFPVANGSSMVISELCLAEMYGHPSASLERFWGVSMSLVAVVGALLWDLFPDSTLSGSDPEGSLVLQPITDSPPVSVSSCKLLSR